MSEATRETIGFVGVGAMGRPMAARLAREMWAAAASLLGPGCDHTELARLCERLAGSELG